ncbi:PfkB family carbohydrate kinase [Paraburkholderia phosphatilytica]|uniref:PfkB family carbohydrate kinase n=1 Tax=Paraburkholderia phosphatilytica TaxID=2282883 RepID=UPI000E4C9F6A|nr:PfkB family carbohydrate kinase [Paraburkholderia phosphatilytica]
MTTIISIGSINVDLQMRVDSRIGNQHMLTARDFMRLAGGKAANVAFVARRLGHDSRLIGMVGDDDFGDEALHPLRDMGVDVSGVRIAHGEPTAVSMIFVPPEGRKHIVLAHNANNVWPQPDLDAALRALGRAPRDSVVAIDCEIAQPACEALVEEAVRRNLRVVLDPTPPERAGTERMREQWPKLLAATPNPEEAQQLTGIDVHDEDSALAAARMLHEHGIGIACVKLGDGGCVVAHADGAFTISTQAIDAVDTTGAADAFCGALTVALAEHQPVGQAARFATAAANLTVKTFGSQPAYPARDDVERHARTLDCGACA